jgi:polyhydroxybutyrate depolymerase
MAGDVGLLPRWRAPALQRATPSGKQCAHGRTALRRFFGRARHGDRSTWPGRLGRWALGLGLGAGALAGCGGSGAPSSTASSVTGPTVPFLGQGCGPALAAGSTSLVFHTGGLARRVIVHVPKGYTGKVSVPVVFDLHGSGSTASAQEALSGMDATADADGFIVVYPEAVIASGSGFDWNVPGQPLPGGARVPASAADDVSFLFRLTYSLPHGWCVDLRRIYVTGFSGGGRMASQLGCDAPNTFAAAAPVSGLRFPTPCSGVRKMPIVAFHGTADRVDPYNGGGPRYWTYSVPEAARRWAANNGCAAVPAQTQPAANVTLSTYTGCQAGATVALYTIAGLGHRWPSGPGAIGANDVRWAFFSAHTL